MAKHHQVPKHQLNDKKIINAWTLFDWANSSYALVIAVAIFPIYFNQVIDDNFTFFGFEMKDTALFSYSISFAYLIIVAMLPLLSGMADYGGKRLTFMKFFTTMGSLACMGLFFFTNMHTMFIGLLGFILAIIGFAGGQVFYNSFLPVIATEDQFDKISAQGFAMGYAGSVLLLVTNLVMIMKPEWFGLESAGMATRISFVMVGLWWLGFAQIPFRRLPQDKAERPDRDLLTKGYRELQKVFRELKTQKNTRHFLASFFFYISGVQTVIYLASTFATDELKFESTELIVVILLLQFVGIIGAYTFAYLSRLKGNKFSILTMLCIWTSICIIAYFVTEKSQFYYVAATVGLVMGGIQSLSRSTYSKLIPEDTPDTASYFSFYDVTEKLAIVIGTFSFGFINMLTGGMRNSILALIFYFIVGMIILMTVKVERGQGANV